MGIPDALDIRQRCQIGIARAQQCTPGSGNRLVTLMQSTGHQAAASSTSDLARYQLSFTNWQSFPALCIWLVIKRVVRDVASSVDCASALPPPCSSAAALLLILLLLLCLHVLLLVLSVLVPQRPHHRRTCTWQRAVRSLHT